LAANRFSTRFHGPSTKGEPCLHFSLSVMNQADKDLLASLRARIDSGEEFNPTLLARYQDLVAQEARESASHVAVPAPVPATPQLTNLQLILQNNTYRDLLDAFTADLQFKIPCADRRIVERFSEVFEFGDSEIDVAMRSFLEYEPIGSSETAVVSLDSAWLKIIKLLVPGCVVLQNEHDASSTAMKRPDTSIEINGALCLRGEAKYDVIDLETAQEELVDKFHPKAIARFPEKSKKIIGIASALGMIRMCLISHVLERLKKFEAELRTSYTVSNLSERVRFIVDLFKIMRWMMTVKGANAKFHLSPGIRRITPNRHHVTWTSEGILKEYNHHRDDIAQRMGFMERVYTHQPPLVHVESGRIFPGTSNCMITRIGNKLQTALDRGTVTRAQIMDGVRRGLQELHDLQLAHCDVSVSNVYVDDDGVVFLDDLEYLTPIDDAPPHKTRLPLGIDPASVTTARQLDELQFQKFCSDINSL